jgi:hypothetical protein
MRENRAQDQGAALLITLAFIVLISILIVGFAASMRTDRPAANMYLEKTKASLYAQSGVDSVIASLRQSTADTNRNWISQPGQLVVGAATDDPTTTVDERKVLGTVVPLHSGAAPSPVPTDPVLQPCNLNVTTQRDPTTSLITDRPDVTNPSVHALMQVAWIYVRKDGTRDTSQTPAVSTTNPIVGRYAYWTDDESSKVNYNLAWGRTTTPPNTNQVGHPTKTSLAALTGLTAPMADAIHNYITDTSQGVNFQVLNQGFFNSPEEARQVDLTLSGVSTALKNNKFEVTHYSNDPDTTFFNQPRIVLTTQATRAGGKPYLNIGVTDVTQLADLEQPTGSQSTRIAAYKATVKMLVSYLKRTDWPMVSNSGSSFQQKYYSSYSTAQQQRLTQLAINIIDYVRPKKARPPS